MLLFLHIFISGLLGFYDFGFVLVVSSGGFLLMSFKFQAIKNIYILLPTITVQFY